MSTQIIGEEVMTLNMSQTDQAYQELKRRLINCDLAPGEYYTELALTRLLGQGKTPTREALARLAQEGWVNGVKGRGYEILPLSLQGIRDAYGARILIEPPAAALAAGKIGAATARQLEALCEQERELDPGQSCEHRIRINRTIHMTILSACGNELLTDILRGLVERCERLVHLAMILQSRHQQLTHQHRDIVDAVINGRADLAFETTRAHLENGEREAVEALLTLPELANARVRLAKQSA